MGGFWGGRLDRTVAPRGPRLLHLNVPLFVWPGFWWLFLTAPGRSGSCYGDTGWGLTSPAPRRWLPVGRAREEREILGNFWLSPWTPISLGGMHRSRGDLGIGMSLGHRDQGDAGVTWNPNHRCLKVSLASELWEPPQKGRNQTRVTLPTTQKHVPGQGQGVISPAGPRVPLLPTPGLLGNHSKGPRVVAKGTFIAYRRK